MKINIWGGSGFLGSHIADSLSDVGHKVTIIDKSESEWIKPNQKFIKGDLLDVDIIDGTSKDADFIFNLAGIADINEANDDPKLSATTNIIGNINLLNAIKNYGVSRYVFASTLYVYSSSGGFYRCSKQACESYINEYSKQFNIDYTILRFGSLYGPRSNEKNAIYRFIKQALDTGEIKYSGSSDARREYVHVKDAADICSELIDDSFINKNIIITGPQSMKVLDLFKMIEEIIGKNIKFNFDTGTDSAHYEITPYTFNPKPGKKYSPNTYFDLGQGLIDLIEHLNQK